MSETTAALAVIDGEAKKAHAGVLMRQATDVAGVCREIVTRTARNIEGRKYVQVEGWQSIAVAYGCVASARDVERVPGGVRAVGEVRRMSDGAVVASAEGFVGEDEPVWFGGQTRNGKTLPKRPDFAIRAMAQTRAISRACRSAFAFVVTMIDGSLSTTPAEEMEGVVDAWQAVEVLPAQRTATTRPATTAKPAARPAAPVASGVTFPNYGRAKGEPVAGASMQDLEFYANGARRSLADPAKARWHDGERRLLAAIEAEMQHHADPDPNNGAETAGEPPPHTDADVPF